MHPHIEKILAFPYYLPPQKAALYLAGYATMMSLAAIFFAAVATKPVEWLVPCVFAACATQAWVRVVAIKRGRTFALLTDSSDRGIAPKPRSTENEGGIN